MNTTEETNTTNEQEQREFLIKGMIDAEIKMTAALERMTAAIKYLADVVGYGVDRKLSEAGIMAKDAHPGLTVSHEIPPDEALKEARTKTAQEAPQPTEPTLETVRDAMNAYAKREGKTAALALIDRYCTSRKVEDVPPERYGDLLLEAAA